MPKLHADYGSCHDRATRRGSSEDAGILLPKHVEWSTIFALGVGSLVGWNSLLAAVDLFRRAFPHSPDAAVWFIWVFEVATLVTLLCLSRAGESLSFKFRFASGFAGIAVVLVSIPVLIKRFSEDVAWPLILGLSGCLAIGSGIVEGSLWAYVNQESSRLDTDYATPAQAGQAFAGLLVCAFRIGTKVNIESDDAQRLCFFATGGLVSGGCAVLGYLLTAHVPAVDPSDVLSNEERGDVRRRVQTLALAIVLLNSMSMAVFPALATKHVSSSDVGLTAGWTTVVLVTLFAATDTLGTLTGVRIFGALGFWKRVRSATLDDTRSRLLLTLAGGRFVLLPVFILQACRRMEGSLLAFSLISILGFTQGAIGVACMKECPDAAVAGMKGGSDRALDQTRSRAMLSQEYAGYLATIATLLGVCVGASCSIPLNMLFS